MSSSFPNSRRLAITGIGLVTPFGEGADIAWRAVQRGASQVRRLELSELLPFYSGTDQRCDLSSGANSPINWGTGWVGAPASFGKGEVSPNPNEQQRESSSFVEPVVEMARRAAREAVADARLQPGGNVDQERLGCVIGTSKGGLRSFERLQSKSLCDHEAANLWSTFLPEAPSRFIARDIGSQGPLLCPVAACATGLVSLIRGAALLREGVCDVVVAGSSDASLRLSVLASFRRLGVLAPASDDPTGDCRPFDHNRQGFVMGEGAGVLILERWDHAIARGAPIRAEWIDGLERGDPSGMTRLDPEATALTRLLGDLLTRSGQRANDIDAVSLHGTGTHQNDLAECRGVRHVLGQRADVIPAFGFKGGMGHLLGGAGSVELALSVLALQDQIAPPNVNLRHPDPECPLHFQGSTPTQRPMRQLLKLSLGFGGHLSAAMIRSVEESGDGC